MTTPPPPSPLDRVATLAGSRINGSLPFEETIEQHEQCPSNCYTRRPVESRAYESCYTTDPFTLLNAVLFYRNCLIQRSKTLLPLFLPASFALLAACFCISRALFMAVSVAWCSHFFSNARRSFSWINSFSSPTKASNRLIKRSN